MSKEIERKFLVRDSSYRNIAVAQKSIAQGYLSTDPDATVRVRISDDKAYLTVKSRNKGATRNEWEYPISPIDARQMLEACSKSRIIEKTRYIVPGSNGLKWEIDEFHGVLEGLVLAEIELPTEDAPFDIPEFIDREVTGDPKYYNSSLATSV